MNRPAWVVMLLLLVSCAREKPFVPEILGEINDEYITTDEFMHHLKVRGAMGLDGRERREFKRWLLAELIDRKLMLQEARDRRINPPRRSAREYYRDLELRIRGKDAQQDVADDLYDQKRIDILLLNAVPPPREPTAKEIDLYIREFPDEFRRPEQVRLRQIVVNSAAKMEHAQAAIEQGMAFAEAARRFSEAPEGKQGGLLGWMTEEELPPSLWQAARQAELKSVIGPIASSYGLHLAVLEGRRAGSEMDASSARARSRKVLIARRKQEQITKYVARLRSRAKIRIDMKALEAL